MEGKFLICLHNKNILIQSKRLCYEIKYCALCLGNILKDFTINNMKKKQD